jgi:Lon protease-like protein
MNGAQFHLSRVGCAGGRLIQSSYEGWLDGRALIRNKAGRSARARAGTPTRQPIWRSALPFHPPWVGIASEGLKRNGMRIVRCLAFCDSHSSSKKRSMNGAQFHPSQVGCAGGQLIQSSYEGWLDGRALIRNKAGRSERARAGTPTRQPIWRSALPFHPPWVGIASEELKRDGMRIVRCLAFCDSHSSSKKRSMNGAQFHLSRVGCAGGRLIQSSYKSGRERVFPQHVRPTECGSGRPFALSTTR